MLPPENLEPQSDYVVTELESVTGNTIPLPQKLQEFASKSERNQSLLVLLCELAQKHFHKINNADSCDDSDLNYLIHICRLVESSEPGIKAYLIEFLVNQPNVSLQQATIKNDLLYTWIEQAEEEILNLKNPENKSEKGIIDHVKSRIADLLSRIHRITRINHA